MAIILLSRESSHSTCHFHAWYSSNTLGTYQIISRWATSLYGRYVLPKKIHNDDRTPFFVKYRKYFWHYYAWKAGKWQADWLKGESPYSTPPVSPDSGSRLSYLAMESIADVIHTTDWFLYTRSHFQWFLLDFFFSLQCVLTDQRIKAIEQVHGYFSSEQVQ